MQLTTSQSYTKPTPGDLWPLWGSSGTCTGTHPRPHQRSWCSRCWLMQWFTTAQSRENDCQWDAQHVSISHLLPKAQVPLQKRRKKELRARSWRGPEQDLLDMTGQLHSCTHSSGQLLKMKPVLILTQRRDLWASTPNWGAMDRVGS